MAKTDIGALCAPIGLKFGDDLMKKGDIVRITGGYFKSDNGLYMVEFAPGDPEWVGRDYCLKRVNKDFTPSKRRDNIAFWPLMVTVSDYEKANKARRHNAEHARIEVVLPAKD